MKHFIEIYRDTKLEYRWRMKSVRNKKVVADSSEGYVSLASCKRAIKSINYGNLTVQTITL